MNQLKSNSKNSATQASPEILEGDSTTGYAATGKRITNWTTNLLATAVVIMIALVAGSHLVSTFGSLTRETEDLPFADELTNTWPALESCALQFGDSNIELQRDAFKGNREEVIDFLQAKCQNVLMHSIAPADEIGEQESKLLNELLKSNSLQSVQQSPGEWRIFHVDKSPAESPLPLVVGIRDNVPSQSHNDTSEDASQTCSRLAVWGMALPDGSSQNDTTTATGDNDQTPHDRRSPSVETNGQWTSFVGRIVDDNELSQLKNNLIPDTARRTLAITGPNGSTLIGFSGGKPNPTKQFFDQLASDHSWNTTQAWRQTGDSWSARYELPLDSPVLGIQVQLHVNHNQIESAQTVRGMLILRMRRPVNHPVQSKPDSEFKHTQ